MALAILKPMGQKNGAYQFKTDIGTSSFYQYAIGSRKGKYRGVDQLESIGFRSPVVARNNGLQKVVGTSFILEIPQHHFDREKDKIQLVSFKHKNGAGKAYSEIVRVLPNWRENEKPLFPNYTLSLENTTMESTAVKHKPFNYRETELSKPMFWGALVAAIPSIIKIATPLVKKLFSKKKKPAPAAPPATTQVPSSAAAPPTNPAVSPTANSSIKDEVIIALADLLGNFKGKNGDGKSVANSLSATSTINPEILIELIPFLEKVISPEAIRAIGDQPIKLFKAIGEAALKMSDEELKTHLPDKNGQSNNAPKDKQKAYAEAKFLSQLIGAIPGIPPIVKAAIAPQTMLGPMTPSQLILKNLLGSINNNGGIQYLNNPNGRFDNRNAEIDNQQLMGLLQSMSVSPNAVPPIRFSVNTHVDVQFINTHLVELNGKNRLVYSKNSDLHFPVKITTDSPNAPQRAFPKVIIQAIFHDADTDQFLFEKKFKLRNINFNEPIQNIIITKEEAGVLPPNKDIKLELSFIWKGRQSQKNRGAFKIHYFSLANEYLFDRLGETSEAPLPLNDVIMYRPFWHKVWEGGFSKSNRWEVNLDVKYYYTLDLEEEAISKLAASKKIEADNAEGNEHPNRRIVDAKIKSGLEVSLPALNQLLSSLSKPILNEAQLDALRSEGLKKYYNQLARTNVELRGTSGDTATLWTYPEIAIHKIHLKRPNNTNKFGQVTEFTEEVVEFPRPSIIHFIGTRSQ